MEQANGKDVLGAVEGIIKSIPVYQDVLQPAAKEIGVGLQTMAKTIHIVLAPVSGLIWGYEKIKNYVATSLEEKLNNLSKENIISPNPIIAVPILEALRYAGNVSTLRDLYINLLATSMDVNTVTKAHPAFVEIIKQLVPDLKSSRFRPNLAK